MYTYAYTFLFLFMISNLNYSNQAVEFVRRAARVRFIITFEQKFVDEIRELAAVAANL